MLALLAIPGLPYGFAWLVRLECVTGKVTYPTFVEFLVPPLILAVAIIGTIRLSSTLRSPWPHPRARNRRWAAH